MAAGGGGGGAGGGGARGNKTTTPLTAQPPNAAKNAHRRARGHRTAHPSAQALRGTVVALQCIISSLVPKVQFFARLWRRRGSTVRRGCSASAGPLGWGSSRAGRSSSASPLRCPGMSSSLAGHLCARACVRACARARAYMRSSVCVGTDRQPTEHGPGEGGTTLQVLPSADWGWISSCRRRWFGFVRRMLTEGDVL